MKRCLELATAGAGRVAPNPMVGCVIVNDDRIIGEGFHTAWGKPHAEVEAINSVPESKRNELSTSTLFVNLEPCSHHGKTPPCADLIIEKKIPHVVIGSKDHNPLVMGKGIQKLKEHGIKVTENILLEECDELNKRFFTFHSKKRPYIILKWAQTADGYIAPEPAARKQISGHAAQVLAHRWRSEEQAVMVGYKTALIDDPMLNVRLWEGNNPIKIVLDSQATLPTTLKIFQGDSPLIVFNNVKEEKRGNTEWKKMGDKHFVSEIIQLLYQRNIISVMVEGGASLLHQFIREKLWDEGRVFVSEERWGSGLAAPTLPPGLISGKENIQNDKLIFYRNK